MGITAIPARALPLRGAEMLSGHADSSPVLLVTLRKVNCLLTPHAGVPGRQGRQRGALDTAPTLPAPQECWGWAAGPVTPHVPEGPRPQSWPADTPHNSVLVTGQLMHTELLAAAEGSEGQRGQSEDPAALGSTQHPSWALMWHRKLTGSNTKGLSSKLSCS